MSLCFIERELLPIEVLHCVNRNFFYLFGICDLDLDPMTFTYELDPHSLEIYRMCENKLPMTTLSKVIVRQTDRQTGPKLYTRRFAGGQ